MAIEVSDSAEFQRLIGALAHELVNANIFYQLHTDLLKARHQPGIVSVMARNAQIRPPRQFDYHP